jgi:hypothetical protein
MNKTNIIKTVTFFFFMSITLAANAVDYSRLIRALNNFDVAELGNAIAENNCYGAKDIIYAYHIFHHDLERLGLLLYGALKYALENDNYRIDIIQYILKLDRDSSPHGEAPLTQQLITWASVYQDLKLISIQKIEDAIDAAIAWRNINKAINDFRLQQ